MPHLNLLSNTSLKLAPQKDYQSAILTYQNQRLSIKEGNTYLIVPISQIIFISADSNYSILHLSNGRKIMTSKTLKVWEDRINHPFFVRCHRSFYINTHFIDKINNKLCNVEIKGQNIPLARSFRHKNKLAFQVSI